MKLETLEDGRWILAGSDIDINTQELRSTQNPMGTKFDPVGLLVGALFSGEMGAKGKLSSLRVVVQPATARHSFVCDGEVGYESLVMTLPKPERPAGKVVPAFIGELLGANEQRGESLWPNWMQVDKVETGSKGRVAFHMADGRLNFACDEGPGSAFTGTRGDQVFPPLEALKGSVETDAENQPKHIVLRGFLGNSLGFETRIDRGEDRRRTYRLMLEPRVGEFDPEGWHKPLWRFTSRVTDYSSLKSFAQELPLADFEVEVDARHFPQPQWLPPGLQDINGHVYAKGSFTKALTLHLDKIILDDLNTSIDLQDIYNQTRSYAGGPLWSSLQLILANTSDIKLEDVSLLGQGEVQFTPELTWERGSFSNWKFKAGTVTYDGLTTDLGALGVSMSASHHRLPEPSSGAEIELSIAGREGWQFYFGGSSKQEAGQPASGEFKQVEKNIPLKLHPYCEKLLPPFISPQEQVNRTVLYHITGEKLERTETK